MLRSGNRTLGSASRLPPAGPGRLQHFHFQVGMRRKRHEARSLKIHGAAAIARLPGKNRPSHYFMGYRKSLQHARARSQGFLHYSASIVRVLLSHPADKRMDEVDRVLVVVVLAAVYGNPRAVEHVRTKATPSRFQARPCCKQIGLKGLLSLLSLCGPCTHSSQPHYAGSNR